MWEYLFGPVGLNQQQALQILQSQQVLRNQYQCLTIQLSFPPPPNRPYVLTEKERFSALAKIWVGEEEGRLAKRA